MNLIGKRVSHKIFGNGSINEIDNGVIKVEFDNMEDNKKFSYPSAFEKFLETEDDKLLEVVQCSIAEMREKKEEERKAREEEALLKSIMETKGKKRKKQVGDEVQRSNISFKCNYCDGGREKNFVGFKGVCSSEVIQYNIKNRKHVWCSNPETSCKKFLSGDITREELDGIIENEGFVCYESQMLATWKAFAGIVGSGSRKGEPMTLKKVKPNSLAMLTTRMPNEDDKERFIFAVFLVDENYEGDKKEEGFVGAHTEYRLQLTLEEAKQVKFWDYYFNPKNPEMIKFGSGLHRYFTDEQSSQVLKKIAEIKKGTRDAELAEKFFQHYCSLKKIDPDKIEIPNGALYR